MMKESDKYEQENALDLKEKEIFDLNENLEYEKEKRKNMERMFQDLTERENELQKQLKESKEKIKVSCTVYKLHLGVLSPIHPYEAKEDFERR